MLTGRIRARNQKDALEQAAKRAEAWYGTGCVSVTLIEPEDESEELGVLGSGEIKYTPAFSANYQAEAVHNWNLKHRGPAVCTECGKVSGRSAER